MVETTEATAYGELVNTSPRLRHQYTGEYWEAEAGLTYLRARWVSPEAGRFVSLDPFLGRQGKPSSLNRYAYAFGDPVQFVDPGGEFGFVSVSFSGITQASFRGFTVGGTASFVAKTAAEVAFEMATGFPVFTSPRSLVSAIRGGANVTGKLATKFWLDLFRGGTDFEKESLKFLSRLGYKKNTQRFLGGTVSPEKSGYFVPDVYVRGSQLLDFKTSFGAVSKKQFQEFIMIANQELGLKVSLVLLRKPTAAQIATMQQWAKEVTAKTGDNDILFSVIHLLD